MKNIFILLIFYFTINCSTEKENKTFHADSNRNAENKIPLSKINKEIWTCYSLESSNRYGIYEKRDYPKPLHIVTSNENYFKLYCENNLNAEGVIEEGRNKETNIFIVKKQISNPYLFYIGEMRRIANKDTMVIITEHTERENYYYFFVRKTIR